MMPISGQGTNSNHTEMDEEEYLSNEYNNIQSFFQEMKENHRLHTERSLNTSYNDPFLRVKEEYIEQLDPNEVIDDEIELKQYQQENNEEVEVEELVEIQENNHEEMEISEDNVHERRDIRSIMQIINAQVPYAERRAILRGCKAFGTPRHEPMSEIDSFKRKFRWPMQVRNIRYPPTFTPHSAFTQVFEDYDIALKQCKDNTSNKTEKAKALAASCFANFASAEIENGALACKSIHSRKRKRNLSNYDFNMRDNTEELSEDDGIDRINLTVSHAQALIRLAGAFQDNYLTSLLTANAVVLQGDNSENYPQRCWTPLPRSRKPCANWRFILAHAEKLCHETEVQARMHKSEGSFLPKLNSRTLHRIQKRVKRLFQVPEQEYLANPNVINILMQKYGDNDTNVSDRENESPSIMEMMTSDIEII